MLNPLKRVIILLLFILTIPFCLYADCPHCYTVAKVKLIMKNGNERFGYIPIYVRYGDRDEIVKDVDLKDYLSLTKQDSIHFVKTYYTFERIGSMFAEEDIEKIIWDSIEHIFFLSWERDFTGACELDKLPLETIQKLKNEKILHVERVIESTYDVIFINQNPDVSEKEFNLLIKYSPTEVTIEEFYSLYHLIVFPQNFQVRYGKPLPLDTVTNSLLKSIEYVKKQIENLSDSYTNPHIRNYLLQIKSKYEKRVKLYKATISYLKDGDITGIKDFTDNEIDNKKTKERMYIVIKKSSNKENRLSNVKEYLDPLYKELSFTDDNKLLFNDVLERNEIIVFIHRWD